MNGVDSSRFSFAISFLSSLEIKNKLEGITRLALAILAKSAYFLSFTFWTSAGNYSIEQWNKGYNILFSFPDFPISSPSKTVKREDFLGNIAESEFDLDRPVEESSTTVSEEEIPSKLDKKGTPKINEITSQQKDLAEDVFQIKIGVDREPESPGRLASQVEEANIVDPNKAFLDSNPEGAGSSILSLTDGILSELDTREKENIPDLDKQEEEKTSEFTFQKKDLVENIAPTGSALVLDKQSDNSIFQLNESNTVDNNKAFLDSSLKESASSILPTIKTEIRSELKMSEEENDLLKDIPHPKIIVDSETKSPEPLASQIDESNIADTNEVLDSNSKVLQDQSTPNIKEDIPNHVIIRPIIRQENYSSYSVECGKILNNKEYRESMPRATSGNTPVYLPETMPQIVLKHSGIDYAISRLKNMNKVRQMLISEESSHVIIPEAIVCGEFLVEERLPIDDDPLYNMGLYFSQPEIFDKAVLGLVKLFSHITLGDLYNSQHPLANMPGNDMRSSVRYDNLALYVVEENGKKQGKIGLIDLEGYGHKSSLAGFEKLAMIFPFHLPIIKNQAKNNGFSTASLDVKAKKGESYLQVGFANHLEWLKSKGVSNIISLNPFKFKEDLKEKLAISVKNELLKMNKGNSEYLVDKKFLNQIYERPKNFLLGDVEETAKEMTKIILESVLDKIEKLIKEDQEQKLCTPLYKNKKELELQVSFRSLIIKDFQFFREAQILIKEYKKINIKQTLFHSSDEIVKMIHSLIMKEWQNSKEIFYYYRVGRGMNEYWIRY